MGELKSLEQARVYSNNINNVDANNMPQNEQNLAIRYALHDIGKKTGEAPEYNFEYSPIDYSETLSSEIYAPYVNPLTDALGMLWNAVPSVGAAFGSFPTEMSSAGIGLLNDALERITGDDYDDPKVQEAKKNWFYDPAAKGSIEWTTAVNDFFDSWKYKPSDKASEEIKVEDFWKTANPNNVAANIGNGVGSVLGFLGSIALTKGMSGSSTKLLGGFKGLSKANVLGSYIYMNNEINQEMTKNGLDPLTSAKLSSLISLPVALSEYIGLSALGKVISKPAMKKAIKGGLEDAVKTYGKNGLTKEMYQDFTAKSIQGITNRLTTVALKSGQGAAIEAVEETVQGKIQQAGEAIYDKIANEEVFGTKLFNEKALKEDLNNAFWGGAIGGLLGMGGGMMNSKEMEESMFHYIGINVQKNRPAKIEGIKKFLTQLEQNGKITPEEAKSGVEMVDKMVKIHQEEMPVTLTDINARYQAYDLINKRNDVQAQLASLDEKPIDKTLSTADNEIKKILEDKIEIYDKAVSLIAKTKGQVSEVGVKEAINLVENQFTKIEEDEKIQEEETKQEEDDVLNTPVQEQAEGKTEEVVAPPVPVIKEERTKEVIEGDIARYENTIKNTDKEIEKLRKSKLRKDETQELRDAKIANLEQKKILLENKINEFSAEIGSQEAGVEAVETIGEAVEAGDTGVSGEVESVGKIISSFDSNTAALVDKKSGIGAVVRKIVEEQKPFKIRFLQKRGLTIEEYNKLGESEKEEIQDAWVNSDEFKALEEVSKETEKIVTEESSVEQTDKPIKRQQKPESAEVQSEDVEEQPEIRNSQIEESIVEMEEAEINPVKEEEIMEVKPSESSEYIGKTATFTFIGEEMTGVISEDEGKNVTIDVMERGRMMHYPISKDKIKIEGVTQEQVKKAKKVRENIKFEQDVINNAVGEKNAEDIVDNMEENGDIKIECE